jgi:hypothetical protein
VPKKELVEAYMNLSRVATRIPEVEEDGILVEERCSTRRD